MRRIRISLGEVEQKIKDAYLEHLNKPYVVFQVGDIVTKMERLDMTGNGVDYVNPEKPKKKRFWKK
jgi:hypothetical protein